MSLSSTHRLSSWQIPDVDYCELMRHSPLLHRDRLQKLYQLAIYLCTSKHVTLKPHITLEAFVNVPHNDYILRIPDQSGRYQKETYVLKETNA